MFEKLLAKQHIRNLDLGSVREKVVEKLGWSPERAQRVEDSYPKLKMPGIGTANEFAWLRFFRAKR